MDRLQCGVCSVPGAVKSARQAGDLTCGFNWWVQVRARLKVGGTATGSDALASLAGASHAQGLRPINTGRRHGNRPRAWRPFFRPATLLPSTGMSTWHTHTHTYRYIYIYIYPSTTSAPAVAKNNKKRSTPQSRYINNCSLASVRLINK